MGKKSGSFRTTISVPRDLKRRMDTVKEGINWSAVACRAFEDKLAETATKKEEKTMAAVIQRLRATKPDALYQQGHEDGRRWASERAEYEDLVRLEQLYVKRRAERDWEKFFDRNYGQPSADQTMDMLSKAAQGKPHPGSAWEYDVTVGERLMKVVCPRLSAGDSGTGDMDFDPGAWRDVCALFWKSIVGNDPFKVDHPSYVRGFAEGALALWSEVKDYL